MHEK
jgi:hypothetical protein